MPNKGIEQACPGPVVIYTSVHLADNLHEAFSNVLLVLVLNCMVHKSGYCKCSIAYRIVSNKRPGGVAIFQKGDVYKRQVFNAKMQCLSLFTMTRHREI